MKHFPSDPAFRIVESGYDRIAAQYAQQRERFVNWREVEEFVSMLPPRSDILDVGCGTGIPVTGDLAERGFNVTGIDISEGMLSMARKNLPAVRFVRMNMVDIDFPPESFEGLVSSFAIFHVPRRFHGRIFQTFFEVLRPAGLMLVSVGASDWEEVADYHGAEMYWSHYDSVTTRSLVTKAGFEIIFARDVSSGGELHHWILARKDQDRRSNRTMDGA